MTTGISNNSSWFASITTPLSFLVLTLTFIEVVVAKMAYDLPDYRSLLIWVMVVSIPTFVGIVIGLAIWRPEALQGKRPLQAIHAEHFASDLYIALDGYLNNLESFERAEAWTTFAASMQSGNRSDVNFGEFREGVAAKILSITNVQDQKVEIRGVIQG
ncbi:MAG: hypothetical protein AAF662_11470 [Pseudomonadota bacterium]